HGFIDDIGGSFAVCQGKIVAFRTCNDYNKRGEKSTGGVRGILAFHFGKSKNIPSFSLRRRGYLYSVRMPSCFRWGGGLTYGDAPFFQKRIARGSTFGLSGQGKARYGDYHPR